MTLVVTESLFKLVAAHERAQANPAWKVGIREDAVWLHTDLWRSFYLTRGGRVLATDDLESEGGPREASDHETSAALVLGARNLAAPQLLDLLPSRPVAAADCSRCRGTRWWPIRDVNGAD